MSLNLPPAALRKLEQTLAQWQHWRDATEIPGAPHVVTQLGGISNYSVLAEAAGRQFCVRLDRVNPTAAGLNRQVEWRALQSAYKAGIAPRPRYFNPEVGSLVCDYLAPDGDQAITPESLAELLRQIHQLPRLHYRLDLAERIRRYCRQLGSLPADQAQILENLDRAMAPLLAWASTAPPGSCLCHNDISPGNLLRSGGRLYILDWEYCAVGNPWFDIATCGLNAGLEPAHQEALLEHYLQRTVTGSDWQVLNQWIAVARYLELLWYLSQRPDYLHRETIDENIARLLSDADRFNRGEALA